MDCAWLCRLRFSAWDQKVGGLNLLAGSVTSSPDPWGRRPAWDTACSGPLIPFLYSCVGRDKNHKNKFNRGKKKIYTDLQKNVYNAVESEEMYQICKYIKSCWSSNTTCVFHNTGFTDSKLYPEVFAWNFYENILSCRKSYQLSIVKLKL